MRTSILLAAFLFNAGCSGGSGAPPVPTAAPAPTAPPPQTSAPLPTTAPATTAPAPKPTTATTFSIQGTVSRRNGKPADSLPVELRPELPIDASDPPLQLTRTKGDGSYALLGLVSGRYFLTAGSGGVGSPHLPLTIAGANLTKDLEIEDIAYLQTFATYTGLVTDGSNKPVAAASVWISGDDCHATTGSNGMYRMVVNGRGEGVRMIMVASTASASGLVVGTLTQAQATIKLTSTTRLTAPPAVCPTSPPGPPSKPIFVPGLKIRELPSTVIVLPSVVPKPKP
jgi:hypothetical protein